MIGCGGDAVPLSGTKLLCLNQVIAQVLEPELLSEEIFFVILEPFFSRQEDTLGNCSL